MTHVLCRIVWAEQYRSKKEDFYAGNMRYPAERKIAHELLNFFNEDGFAYGYVEGADSHLRLENLGSATDANSIDGITVIWCSLDRETRSLRVVGWYDNATAFRDAKNADPNSIRETWRYYFRTKYENAHLIPEPERELIVPTRARRTDKGFIGQRNWHFPEQHIAQHQRFLDSFAALKLGYSGPRIRSKIDRRSFEEGQQATAEIIATVRNPGLVKAAKARFGYNCSVCKFNFEQHYGPLGKGFIEVHHLFPLAVRRGKRQSTTDDVRVVCANCHRMLHRKAETLTIPQLKALLKKHTSRKK